MLDAGIAQREGGNYSTYNTGSEKGIFVKSYFNGSDFTGRGKANDEVYPDFFDGEAVQWWQDQIDAFHKTLKFDGLWLNKNEASNLCDGVCYREDLAEQQSKHLLPYTPTGRDLETGSISLDAWHNNTRSEI